MMRRLGSPPVAHALQRLITGGRSSSRVAGSPHDASSVLSYSSTMARPFHTGKGQRFAQRPPFSSGMARGSLKGKQSGKRNRPMFLSREQIAMSRNRMPLSRSRMPLGIAGIRSRGPHTAGLTQYNLEVPFAILDSRNGVWADILKEISSTYDVEIGRHRNQFSRTLLTIHAPNQETFDQVADAIRNAHESRVYQTTVPIPDKQAKLRIVGHNGVRMASVGKNHKVSIRYCEAESCAYVQGSSQRDVERAAVQLDANEHRVEIERDSQMQMLMAQDAIMLKALENKWKVKISIPEAHTSGLGKQEKLANSRFSRTPSVNNISFVGKEEKVEGALGDVSILLDHSAPIDLSPWYKRKIITIPHARRDAVIGERGANLAKIVDSVYGVTSRRASPLPSRGAPQNQPIDVSVGGSPESVDNALGAIRRAIGTNVEIPFAQAARLISKDLNQAIRAMAEKHQVSIMRPSFAYFQAEIRRCFMDSSKPPPMQFRVSFGEPDSHATAIDDLKALAKTEDWSLYKVDVPRWHMRRVVGNRFENLQKAMDENNVTISIDRDSASIDNMILEIEGPEASAFAARGVVEELVSPPSWTEKRSITIPSRRMASLGGKQFVRLTAAKENLDVVLYVKNPPSAAESHHEIVIEGTPEGVNEAYQRVEKMIGVERVITLPTNESSGATEFAGLSSDKFSSKEFRQIVLSAMKSFMQKWGTTIDFQNVSKPQDGLSILGPTEEAVQNTISDIHSNTEGRTHTLTIPPYAQFRVLGKNNANIGKMKYNYGVAVELADASDDRSNAISAGGSSSALNSNRIEMIITGTESGVAQAVQHVEQKIGVEEIIEVPAPYGGVIVGKHQHIIQQIQKLSGAVVLRVPMGTKRSANAKQRFIVRAIDREQADMAIDMMRAIVERHRNMPSEEIYIPENLWGLFIGTRGDNIRSLEMRYDVKIQSPSGSGESTYGMSFEQRMLRRQQKLKDRESGKAGTSDMDDTRHKNIFVIRGDERKNVDAAISAVRGFLRAPWGYANFNDDRVYAEVEVPFAFQGKIIGYHGENVKRLKEHFNVEARIPPESTNSTVCIFKGESVKIIEESLVAVGRLVGLEFRPMEERSDTGAYVYKSSDAPGVVRRRKQGHIVEHNVETPIKLSRQQQEKLLHERTMKSLQGKRIPIGGIESLSGLAKKLRVPVSMIKSICVSLGFTPKELANPHSQLDADQIELVVLELGAEPIKNTQFTAVHRSKRNLSEGEGTSRPPVVVVMGHVDHGKTTLLDCLRGDNETNVADTEAGGITQVTTAFTVGGDAGSSKKKKKKPKKIKKMKTNSNSKGHSGGNVPKRKTGIDSKILPAVTFIDTPGHAAFTVMRESGINSTDILVLVVAADDGVMAQTLESATTAKEMGLPIVVAITKCDIDGIDPGEAQERIENELATHGVQSERLGGDVQVVQVSGATGEGKDELIETLALQAEIMGLRADASANGEAVVLEGSYVKGMGHVADVVVQWGTLKPRDVVVVGGAYGRVRSLVDPSSGTRLKSAGPSQPARVIGLEGTPHAGDDLIVVDDLEYAREAAENNIEREKWSQLILDQNESDDRRDIREEQHSQERDARGPWWRNKRGNNLRDAEDDAFMNEDGTSEIPPPERNIFLVAQSDGGMKAVEGCVAAVEKEMGVCYPVLRNVIGDVSSNDIEEAAASEALVFTYNTKIPKNIEMEAKRQGVKILDFNLIYELEDQLRENALEMKPVQFEERRSGKAEVLQIFQLSGKDAGVVIGLRVKSGELGVKNLFRLIRDDEVIADNLRAESLRIVKDDVQNVPSGSDCGLVLVDENGDGVVAEEFDIIESYTMESTMESRTN